MPIFFVLILTHLLSVLWYKNNKFNSCCCCCCWNVEYLFIKHFIQKFFRQTHQSLLSSFSPESLGTTFFLWCTWSSILCFSFLHICIILCFSFLHICIILNKSVTIINNHHQFSSYTLNRVLFLAGKSNKSLFWVFFPFLCWCENLLWFFYWRILF